MAGHTPTSEQNEAPAVFDRTGRAARAGSVGWVLLLAAILVAAAAGLFYVGPDRAERYIFGLLAVLATAGTFCLFAIAAGILRFSTSEGGSALLKSAIDNAVDAIVITESGGKVIYANSAYLELTGATAADVRPVERVFIGDPDVSESIYRLLNAARDGKRLQEEVRIAAGKGEPGRWLRLRVRPLGENAKLSVWSVADISRERERQENVFQELQHAIDYLDHAPAGFFSADAKGALVYLNATLAGWLDYDLASVGSGGLTLSDIVAGEGAALLSSRNAAPGDVKTDLLDLDLKTRSGKTVPVRIFHKVAYGADGEPGVSRTLVLNRGRGDDGLDVQRAAEVRFMRFFHNTPMAIATVDKTGRVARENPRFAKDFAAQLRVGDLADRSILRIVAERDRPALEAAIRKAAERVSDIAPVQADLAGPGERSADFFVSAVEEGDGEAAIVYALDTTAQRTLDSQIRQQQKMETVGTMAGGIAHDFNNVLSAILMATDFLLNAHKPTDPSFQDIIQIRQNANRAAALVRQLLAFGRKQTLRPQVLDLREALSDIGMLIRRLIGEKVTLAVEDGRDLWSVLVDISQFEQVIVNLALNARDAMPNGGKLTVRTRNVAAAESAQFAYEGMPAADYVLVEVGDTGTGIAADIIDKIFEPFFTTKEIGKGTGLGLSSVYGIIKQTGGFIYVESQPGQTTFRIFLPRHVASAEQGVRQLPAADAPAIAEAMSAASAVERAAAADFTGQGTILLVEDEEGLRALNARGLTSRGYTVLQAANGVEAIEVLDKQGGNVDLVVSDVVMPEMDGPTLLKELRRRDPAIKFIFVSGYAEDAFAKSLPEGAPPDFLPKPFTLKQLVAAVKKTMTA